MIRWQIEEKNKSLIKKEIGFENLPENWSRVKVVACGLCHTDLGFIFSEVKTRRDFPITLGHEISGIVVDGPMSGKKVIIPAVMPCGNCPACLKGYERICQKQIMPGNDIHGGFSEFIDVPSRFLAEVPDSVSSENLKRFSVIADAVTTPLQAIKNLQLNLNDLAIVIGCGGVGTFTALLAKSLGAHVVVFDIDDRKLEQVKSAGIDHCLNTRSMDIKAIKDWLKAVCKSSNYDLFAHRIFETSGTKIGQETAFALLGPASKMAVVGFTMEKAEYRLSNLMAFDAQLIGNWGASPSIYPEAIKIAMSGALHLDTFTELYPMDLINEVIEKAHRHELIKRAVLYNP